MAEQSDRALIEAARAGSAAAFEDLMKTYEHLVYRMCFAYTGSRDDALDVTQDVFIKVYKKIGSLKGSGSFKAWLLRITHNESMNWIRARSRRGDHDELTAVSAQGFEARQESDLYRKESRDLLGSALLHLNAKQRQAITLRYFERMPLREIASLLGCTEGTVKNILFRSLQKLRSQLVPNWRES